MGRKLLSLLTGSDDMAARNKDAPLGFVCTPEGIAATVAHLCSEDGRYITEPRQ